MLMKPLCLLAGMLALAACSSSPPSTPTAQAPTRHVMSAPDHPDRATAESYLKSLPARLDEETAKRVLVHVNPDQVTGPGGKRTLQGAAAGILATGGVGVSSYGCLLCYGQLAQAAIAYGGLSAGVPYGAYNIGSYMYYPYGSYMYPYQHMNNMWLNSTALGLGYNSFLWGGLRSGYGSYWFR